MRDIPATAPSLATAYRLDGFGRIGRVPRGRAVTHDDTHLSFKKPARRGRRLGHEIEGRREGIKWRSPEASLPCLRGRDGCPDWPLFVPER
jgi:hypothetical protein